MKLLRAILRQTAGMLKITAILMLPLLVTLVYLRLNVSMSSLKRATSLAALRKEELVKRNRALKSALTDLALAIGENPYRWQSYESLPLSIEDNKIVRIHLPERFTDNAPEESLQAD